MNLHTGLFYQQKELAKDFLMSTMAFSEEDAERRWEEVDMDYRENQLESEHGYYEINWELCVTNADKFCHGLNS